MANLDTLMQRQQQQGITDLAASVKMEGELLCEGYLLKRRGLGQNRRRWFRLTETCLSYQDADGGDLIDRIPRKVISQIDQVASCRFLLTTSVPVGRSMQHTMLLETSSPPVCMRWLDCLRKPKEAVRDVPLLCEGYLTKLKPITQGLNRRRWFRLTMEALTYSRRNQGELMATCAVSDIVAAFPVKSTVLVIEASKPFTVSGDSRVFLHCRTAGARTKWLKCLQRSQPARIVRELGAASADRPQLQQELAHISAAIRAGVALDHPDQDEGARNKRTGPSPESAYARRVSVSLRGPLRHDPGSQLRRATAERLGLYVTGANVTVGLHVVRGPDWTASADEAELRPDHPMRDEECMEGVVEGYVTEKGRQDGTMPCPRGCARVRWGAADRRVHFIGGGGKHALATAPPPVDTKGVRIGMRVIRGPDWDPDSTMDGGSGCAGTVTAFQTLTGRANGFGKQLQNGYARVSWDSGAVGVHAVGGDRKHELRTMPKAHVTCENVYLGQEVFCGRDWDRANCTKMYNCQDDVGVVVGYCTLDEEPVYLGGILTEVLPGFALVRWGGGAPRREVAEEISVPHPADVYQEKYGTPSGRETLKAAFEEFAASVPFDEEGDEAAILSAPIGFRGLFCLRMKDELSVGVQGDGEASNTIKVAPETGQAAGEVGALAPEEDGGRLDSGDEMAALRIDEEPVGAAGDEGAALLVDEEPVGAAGDEGAALLADEAGTEAAGDEGPATGLQGAPDDLVNPVVASPDAPPSAV